MQHPPGLDDLGARLLKRGAPPRYVGRLIAELAAHREDLVGEMLNEGLTPESAALRADQRLGDPAVLADAVLTKVRRGSFLGRNPVLSWIVLPVLLLPLSWAGLLFLAAWLGGILSPSSRSGTISGQGPTILSIASFLCAYCVPAASGAAFYWLARRRCCGGIWAWTPCLLLSALS